MILDPYGQFIKEITDHCDLSGKTILEVGCGQGRITRDLARHARRVVAIDPDEGALQTARSRINAENVAFLRCRGESLPFPEGCFDLVVYSLSLHHLPQDAMRASLAQAAGLLGEQGMIMVIEPGEGGTLIEAEERFGVGDGNEAREKDAARRAIAVLPGWRTGLTICCRIIAANPLTLSGRSGIIWLAARKMAGSFCMPTGGWISCFARERGACGDGPSG